MDFILVTRPVFWILIRRSGSNFGNNYTEPDYWVARRGVRLSEQFVSTLLTLSSNVCQVFIELYHQNTLRVSATFATLSLSLCSLIDAVPNTCFFLNRNTSSDRFGHCAHCGPGCQRSQSWVRNASVQCLSAREYATWNTGPSADCSGQRRRPQCQDKVR